METSQSISQSQTNNKCGRLSQGSFLLLWLVQLPIRLQTHHLHRLASLGWHVGNNISVAWEEAIANRRVLVGYVMIGVGVFFYEAHLLFINPHVVSVFACIPDPEVPKTVWYYKSWFYWFFTNREEFLFGFALTGFFLRTPSKFGYRWALVPLVSICFTEIFYQSFFVNAYTGFYSTPTWEVWTIVLLSVIPAYICLDYAAYRKYHLKDGTLARILGMIKVPMMNWDEKGPYLEKLTLEMEDFNNRI